MQTCECTFGDTGRLYTYLTLTHYPVGTVVLAEVGEEKVQPVTVRGNHPSPAYLDPRITYRWILGTPVEVRAAFAHAREFNTVHGPSTVPMPEPDSNDIPSDTE